MQISELIATLHHEVTKSFTYIAETKGGDGADASVLHLTIERVEVELPITLSQQDVEYKPADLKGQPIAYKKLMVPFTSLKGRLPSKAVTGKAIMAEVVGHTEKIDDRVSPESVGRIKVTFKVVIS